MPHNELIDEKPENPPAFPHPGKPKEWRQYEGEPFYAIYGGQPGMTLRDYFAAVALQGMLASGHQAPLEQLTVVQGGKPADGLALAAYGFADALLKVRTNG